MPPAAYDVFLSYSHADQPWVRELAERLSRRRYNGRPLRVWLDERFLDPGELGGDAELTTALDRSRFLAAVLSPESVASRWVRLEVEHFLKRAGRDAVIPLLHRDCAVPELLGAGAVLDGRAPRDLEALVAELAARLTPPTGTGPEAAGAAVDEAFERAVADDPGGFAPGPTPARDALAAALLRHDVDDLGENGLALAAFDRAAERLEGLEEDGSDRAYNVRMLLGECVAAGMRRSPGYRQVARRYLDRAETSDHGLALRFVVARASSKVAETDPGRVDASLLLRTADQLDRDGAAGREVRVLAMLLGRTLAKLRASPAGELAIVSASEAGPASRVAAACALGVGERSEPVSYLSESWQGGPGGGAAGPPVPPPSRRLLGQLFGMDLDQPPMVADAVRLAREELSQAHPGMDFPYGALWGIRREALPSGGVAAAPFAGTVVRVTRADMVERAERVDASTVACLTETRIVEALFEACGALLLVDQDPDSPQCRRLRDRSVPFAVVGREVAERLEEGTHVVVRDGELQLLRG